MDESEKKNIRIEGDSTMFKNIRQNNSLKAFRHRKKQDVIRVAQAGGQTF